MNGKDETERNQNDREVNDNGNQAPNETNNDGATGNIPGATGNIPGTTGVDPEVLRLQQEVAAYRKQCANQMGIFQCIEELVGPELMDDFLKARGRMSDRIREIAGSGRGETNDDCDGAKDGDGSKRKDESVKPKCQHQPKPKNKYKAPDNGFSATESSRSSRSGCGSRKCKYRVDQSKLPGNKIKVKEEEVPATSDCSGTSREMTRSLRSTSQPFKGVKPKVVENYSSESDDEGSDGGPMRETRGTVKSKVRSKSTNPYVTRKTNKGVPEPEEFEVDDDKEFRKFLDDFERYCRSEYSSDQRDWVRVLGRFLGPEAKKMYGDVKRHWNDYGRVIKELEKWVKVTRKTLKIDYQTEFNNAKMEKGDTLYFFAIKMEGLAEKVYGRKFKKPLKEKFLECVPPEFAKQIRQGDRFSKQTTGKSQTWEEIKEQAGLEREIRTREPKTKEPTTVVIENAKEVEYKKFTDVWPRSVGEDPVTVSYDYFAPEVSRSELDRMYREDAAPRNSRPERRPENPGLHGPPRQGPDLQAPRERSMSRRRSETPGDCWYCGRSGHWRKDCRYKLGLCIGCGGPGHFVRNCPQQQGLRPRTPSQGPGPSGEGIPEGNRNRQASNNQQRDPQRGRTPEQEQLLN